MYVKSRKGKYSPNHLKVRKLGNLFNVQYLSKEKESEITFRSFDYVVTGDIRKSLVICLHLLKFTSPFFVL